jgi:hypothetical protein
MKSCALIRPITLFLLPAEHRADGLQGIGEGYSMSTLSAMIAQASAGLSVQQRISDEKWAAIAQQCGDEEIAEIRERIDALRVELATVEDWDGDTQDEINLAISHFSWMLRLTTRGG